MKRPKVPPLASRDLDLLRSLNGRLGWQRPMDVGGHDGSFHGAALRKLARRGFVEQRAHANTRCRATYQYRLARKGRELLRAIARAHELLDVVERG